MHWSLLQDSIAILSIKEDNDGCLHINGYARPPTFTVRGFIAKVSPAKETLDTYESRLSMNIDNTTYYIEVRYDKPFEHEDNEILTRIDKRAAEVSFMDEKFIHFSYNKLVQIYIVLYGQVLCRLRYVEQN